MKISHRKDGRRRQPHRFHVSRPPPYPAAISATDLDESAVVITSPSCGDSIDKDV